jgi:hypothetical protein
VLGEDDAAAAGRLQECRREGRSRLDVHVVGAQIVGSPQNPLPFLFAAAEASALPVRATGDDDGRPATEKCPRGVRPIGVVEADLDQIGIARGIPRAADLLHRRSGGDDAQLGVGHGREP